MRRALGLLILGATATLLPAGLAAAMAGQAGASGYWPAPTAPVPGAGTPFRTLHVGTRSYVLHPPPLSSRPRPLVVLLPGLYRDWRSIEADGTWSRYADGHGFVAAYGVGIGRSWNAGSCCGSAQRQGVDDVSYLAAVVADVSRRIPIDPTRVYLVGFSNGDMMGMRAQCDRPDLFAATGGAAGALVAPCRSPDRQLRVRHLHGVADTVVPYFGGFSTFTGTTFPAVAELPGLLAADSPDPRVSIISLPCGHRWPRLDNACRANGTDLIWRWLSRFTRDPWSAVAARSR